MSENQSSVILILILFFRGEGKRVRRGMVSK